MGGCACATCNKRLGPATADSIDREAVIENLVDLLVDGDVRDEEEQSDEDYDTVRAWVEPALEAVLTGTAAQLSALLHNVPTWINLSMLAEGASGLLIIAAQLGRAFIINTLVLEYGASVDHISTLDPAQRCIGTALHHACSAGHVAAVRILLELGASPDELDGTYDRCTALHVAVLSDRPVVAEALLQAGANPNKPDYKGATPLWYCGCHGAIDCIPVLGQYGADAFAADDTSGLNPAEVADKFGYKRSADAIRRLQQRQRMLATKQQRQQGAAAAAASTASEAELRRKQQEADAAMMALLAELESSSVDGSKGRDKQAAGGGKASKRKQHKGQRKAGGEAGAAARADGSSAASSAQAEADSHLPSSWTSQHGGEEQRSSSPTSIMLPSLAAVLQPEPQAVMVNSSARSSSSQDTLAADGLARQPKRQQRRPVPAPAPLSPLPQQSISKASAEPAPPPLQPQLPAAPADPVAALRAEWDALLGRAAGLRDLQQQAELAAEIRGRMDEVAAAGISLKYAKKVLGKLDKAASTYAELQAVELLDLPGLQALLEAARPLQAMLPVGSLAPAEQRLAALQAEQQRLEQERWAALAESASRGASPAPALAAAAASASAPTSSGSLYSWESAAPAAAVAAPAPVPPHLQHQFGYQEAPQVDDGLSLDQECVVCLAAHKTVLCVPCGHVCVCAGCMPLVEASGSCPLCRVAVDSLLPLF